MAKVTSWSENTNTKWTSGYSKVNLLFEVNDSHCDDNDSHQKCCSTNHCYNDICSERKLEEFFVNLSLAHLPSLPCPKSWHCETIDWNKCRLYYYLTPDVKDSCQPYFSTDSTNFKTESHHLAGDLHDVLLESYLHHTPLKTKCKLHVVSDVIMRPYTMKQDSIADHKGILHVDQSTSPGGTSASMIDHVHRDSWWSLHCGFYSWMPPLGE